MNEIYEFDGIQYDVAPNRLEEFMLKFPDAVKVEDTQPELTWENAINDVDIYSSLTREEKRELARKNTGEKSGYPMFSGGPISNAILGSEIIDAISDIPDWIKASQSAEFTETMFNLAEDTEAFGDEDYSRVLQLMDDQSKKPPSAAMQEYYKTVEEEGGGAFGVIKAFAKNPKIAPEALVTSLAGMIRATGSNKAAKYASLAGFAGLATGSPVRGGQGLFSGLSMAMETTSKFSELLSEEMKDMPGGFTEENLKKIVEDKDKFQKIKNKAYGKGVTVGIVDFATGGLTTAVSKKVLTTTGSKVGTAVAGTVVEGVGGGTGEALSSVVIGEDVNAADVGLEIFAEYGRAPLDIGAALVKPNNYILNGQKVSFKEMKNFVETADDIDVATADIKIEGDDVLAEKAYNKQNDAILETQVNEKVEDLADRKKMVELEKQRVKAKADVKKEGVQAVPGAKETLENIEMQMNEIVGKYTAIDGRTKDVKARKKTAQEVKTRLDEIKTEATRVAAAKTTATIKKQMEAVDKETGRKGQIIEMNSEDIAESEAETIALYEAEVEGYKQKLNNIKDKKSKEYKDTQDDLNEVQETLDDIKDADTQFGYIIDYSDGSYDLIINKDKPMVGTAAHEFQHRVLARTLKNNQNIQDKAGSALTDYVTGKFGGVSPAFINRMGAYINPKTGKQVSQFGEEIITVMSESILDGSLKYNENLFTRVGDVIRQTLQRVGAIDIKFDTGKDIYNFIKDYNRSIEKDYVSKAITKMAVEGVEGKIVKTKDTKPKKTTRKASKVSPRADQFIKAEINNEMLVDITKSSLASKEDTFGAIEALVEKNWPIISKALKFNPTGEISMQSIKEAVSEQMMGIFPKITLPDGKTINRKDKRLLDTYDKTQNVKVTTFLDNTLRPRQAEIFTRAKTIDAVSQGVSLDEAKNIAVSTELENETSNQRDTRKRINVLKIPKVAKVAKDIRQDTKIEEGDTHKQVTKNNEGHIGKKIFNVPENKITKPKDNLTTSDDIVDVKTGKVITKEELDAGATGILSPSESKNIQDVFSDYETSEQFIKILPIKNVSEKDALVNEIGENIPVSRDVYGRAIGLQDRILEYFYEPLMKPNGKRARSQGKTSQVPIWTLKEKFINPKKDVVVQFQRDLGITEKKQINILPTKEKRSEIGQLLKGAARTLSQQVSLSAAQRNLEAIGAPKQQIADITAGQRRRAYSKDAEKINNDRKKKKIFDGELVPKETYLVETEKEGKIEVKIITRRDLQQYQNVENKITWEEFYMSQIIDFLNVHPEYYDIMSTGLTGGIKKAAFFNIPYFKKTITKFAKKNNKENVLKKARKTKQIKPSRLHYHTGSKWKGLKNIDLSKDNGKLDFLVKFFKDVAKHGKGQEIFQELLTHLGFDQSNFMRHSAITIGYPVDSKGKEVTNELGVEEHDPQMEMARILFASALDGNVDNAIKVLQASYSQISLRKKDDPSGDLRQSRGDDFFNLVVPRILDGSLDFLPNGYASIYRLMKSGVDPFAYKLINEKQTIAEYFGVDNLNVEKAKQAIINIFEGKQDIKVLREQSKVKYSKDIDGHNKLNKAINKSRSAFKQRFKKIQAQKQEAEKFVESIRPQLKKPKGITVLDFDDTLATTKSLVKYTTPEGKTGTLNAEEYASTYEDLLDKGYTFDFSDFNKVVKGKLAPLFNKAMKLQGKFGPENMFVLTARPPAAQKAIFDFLKANGLNIPLKNITGLGNSTAEAKALWVADKVGEGYNDFYFADDALQNVQAVKNMLDQFDVKSKVQQAKVKFSKSMNDQFNDILENVTGIESKKRFSAIKGRKRGESKGKFRFFIPPSHEDFVGLLYNFLGKGKEGNAHRDFFEKALIRPLNRANREYDTARQSVANDYKALNKQFPDIRKKLTKKTPDGDFTFQDAIRVYLWNKHGHNIPGLSETDQTSLSELVMSDPQLQAYAETLNVISKQDAYVTPTEGWNSGDIRMDLDDATGRIGRQQFFGEFIENTDIIFSEENLNKIEAGYGKGVRESLEDMLYRIKTGRNRPTGQNEQVNKLMNYLNGSVGTVMFFNMRSALLQQMSLVNYINFADNNIFAAAKAFANQKQYWADWAYIFNSDTLKQRRGGIQTDVNGAELAASLRNSKDITRKLISKLLELGFLPTQIGDNIAIATGGATYYRNRINTYLKQGLSQKEAEAKAFDDFQAITQSTQQSARPDMVSKQQASVIGKVILNFQNVTSQFNRLGKKAFQDIYNRRITKPNATQMQSDISNAARITYYFAVQNAIFYTLQTALFAMMFDDDEEDVNNLFIKKKERLINGSIDSVLRGSGLIGGVVATLKNVAIAFARQRDVNYNPDESAVALEALNLSPVLGIKLRKIVNAEKTLNYNKKVIKEMETFDIDNPQWSAVTNYTEALTNVPLNRLYNKTQNVRQALNNEHSAWERSLMFLGWSQYNLNLENKKMEEIKEKVRSKKKSKNKSKKKTAKEILEEKKERRQRNK